MKNDLTDNTAAIQHALKLSSLEWLETCGTGGFAFSTSRFVNTRRYHALLVAGSGPDDSRAVLLSRLDEVVSTGLGTYPLGTRLFKDTCAPRGFEVDSNLTQNLFPEWHYTLPDGTALRKAVLALHGENTVLVRYTLEREAAEIELALEPFCAMRQYHSLVSEREDEMEVLFSKGHLAVRNETENLELYVRVAGSKYVERDEWHEEVYYPEEERRGYDCLEDLFLPGVLTVDLTPGIPCFVVISDSEIEIDRARDLWEEELVRRQSMAPESKAAVRSLFRAADQFLVRDSEGRLDVIAGYPWFTCWARDTMISLPGLCLVTGRFSEARDILKSWEGALSEGMLPNRLGVEAIKYNTVDGTLWFVIACYRYLEASGDDSFLDDSLWRSVLSIVDHHLKGTRYNIKVDASDSLLAAGAHDTQLTWMDACYNGVPVTPRSGKAVEINALWYNVLRIGAYLAQRVGAGEKAETLNSLAEKVRGSFEEYFWSEERGYLADWVRGETVSYQLRPNQLFALSLPFPVIEGERAERVLEAVRSELLTPFGLRTLAPSDLEYIPVYGSNLRERDLAYHQGTVWPWLLGAYANAVFAVKGEKGRQEVEELFAQVLRLLEVGGRGSASEVFDGDFPHEAGGCPAQAWSVAALLEMADLVGLV
jgi:predicted glycogen debranching enzyme